MQFNQSKIKIGVLTPYSSIFPYLTPSFVNGFYSAIPSKYQDNFQMIPEYINQGGDKIVKNAIQKLINFDNVDILSGVISYKTLPEIVPLIEQRKKLSFFMDMGEYIPYTQNISNLLFFNSFQLWQSEYALGYWAHKMYGDKGSVIMPIYDSGYHMHNAFRQGAIASGSQIIDFVILPYSEGNSQVEGQIENYFEKIRKEKPAYVHALFCGNEAVEFIHEFYKSGLYKDIPLIISAHMASEDILSEVKNLNMKFYSASMWNYESESIENKIFKEKFWNQTGDKANIHALLGYEMGSALFSIYPELQKRDWDTVIEHLKQLTVKSPRGERSFYLDSGYSTPLINIEKIGIGDNSIHKVLIEQGRSLKYDHSIFTEIHQENVTGWQNPYLCV